MASTKNQTIHFRNNDSQKSIEAQLLVSLYDDKDRVKRALTKLGIFWLLATISIVIPLAHFVLVPGFFLAGIFLALEAYQAAEIIEHADGICPTCNEQIKVKFEPKDEVPKWTYCPKCSKSLHIDN